MVFAVGSVCGRVWFLERQEGEGRVLWGVGDRKVRVEGFVGVSGNTLEGTASAGASGDG